MNELLKGRMCQPKNLLFMLVFVLGVLSCRPLNKTEQILVNGRGWRPFKEELIDTTLTNKFRADYNIVYYFHSNHTYKVSMIGSVAREEGGWKLKGDVLMLEFAGMHLINFKIVSITNNEMAWISCDESGYPMFNRIVYLQPY